MRSRKDRTDMTEKNYLFLFVRVFFATRQTLLFGGSKNGKTGELIPAQRDFKVSWKAFFCWNVSTCRSFCNHCYRTPCFPLHLLSFLHTFLAIIITPPFYHYHTPLLPHPYCSCHTSYYHTPLVSPPCFHSPLFSKLRSP